MTEAERRLWSLIRAKRFAPVKFRRQQPFGPYILDFYCHQLKLAIELYGGQHFEEDGERRDLERTRYLEDHGLSVLRFTNLELLRETEGVLSRIRQIIEEGPSPQPSPSGRGGQ